MTTYQFFTTAWTWNSIVLILSAIALVGYFLTFGQRGRPLYFARRGNAVVFRQALRVLMESRCRHISGAGTPTSDWTAYLLLRYELSPIGESSSHHTFISAGQLS